MANNDTHGDLSILEAGAQNATSRPRRALADVTILGLRLWPRRKTDAEYITSVRKVVKYSKWMAVVYGVVAVVGLGGSMAISYIAFQFAFVLMPAESVMDEALAGAAVGLLFGTIAGYLFVQGGASFIQMLTVVQDQRTERLMLKFHDELMSREGGAPPTDSVDQP
jgi:hypothetical protein